MTWKGRPVCKASIQAGPTVSRFSRKSHDPLYFSHARGKPFLALEEVLGQRLLILTLDMWYNQDSPGSWPPPTWSACLPGPEPLFPSTGRESPMGSGQPQNCPGSWAHTADKRRSPQLSPLSLPCGLKVSGGKGLLTGFDKAVSTGLLARTLPETRGLVLLITDMFVCKHWSLREWAVLSERQR